MNMYLRLAAIAAAVGAASAAVIGLRRRTGEPVLKDAFLAKLAPVKLAVARATALAARPGRIFAQRVEEGVNGTGLSYVFDIRGDGAARDVRIDAKTGAVMADPHALAAV